MPNRQVITLRLEIIELPADFLAKAGGVKEVFTRMLNDAIYDGDDEALEFLSDYTTDFEIDKVEDGEIVRNDDNKKANG